MAWKSDSSWTGWLKTSKKIKKTVSSSPAADPLDEEEQLALEHSTWEEIGSTGIEESFLVLNTGGNASRANDKEDTESAVRVFVEEILRLRKFLSDEGCNEALSDFNGNVKNVNCFFQRIATTRRFGGTSSAKDQTVAGPKTFRDLILWRKRKICVAVVQWISRKASKRYY